MFKYIQLILIFVDRILIVAMKFHILIYLMIVHAYNEMKIMDERQKHSKQKTKIRIRFVNC